MVVKLGKERPLVSMDTKTGKFMWTRNNDVLTSTVRGTGKKAVDGERVFLSGGSKTLDPSSCTRSPFSTTKTAALLPYVGTVNTSSIPRPR